MVITFWTIFRIRLWFQIIFSIWSFNLCPWSFSSDILNLAKICIRLKIYATEGNHQWSVGGTVKPKPMFFYIYFLNNSIFRPKKIDFSNRFPENLIHFLRSDFREWLSGNLKPGNLSQACQFQLILTFLSIFQHYQKIYFRSFRRVILGECSVCYFSGFSYYVIVFFSFSCFDVSAIFLFLHYVLFFFQSNGVYWIRKVCHPLQ